MRVIASTIREKAHVVRDFFGSTATIHIRLRNDRITYIGAVMFLSSGSEWMSSSCKARRMEPEREMIKDFPEELVIKIVAMLPFPSIVRARCLSKSWLTRFSPISSQDDETNKGFATLFQKLVGESFNSWKTFYPISFGNEKSLTGYDWAAQMWRKLPSLSFLPKNLVLARSTLEIQGALLYVCTRTQASRRAEKALCTRWIWEEIEGMRTQKCIDGVLPRETGAQHLVINILTRSWKKLPPRPKATASRVVWKKLVSHTLVNYKIIMVCVDFPAIRYTELNQYFAQIYDSKSNAWSRKELLSTSDSFGSTTVAYLNGILYIASKLKPLDLLAFNLEEGTLEQLRLSFRGVIPLIDYDLQLLVCNGDLFMIKTVSASFGNNHLHVLKIDLGSLQLLEGARSPSDIFKCNYIDPRPASEDNCLFFRSYDYYMFDSTRVLVYNVEEDGWNSFYVPVPDATRGPAPRRDEWCHSSFQPGLNPFVAV